MTTDNRDSGVSHPSRLVRFALLIAIVIALNLGGSWITTQLNFQFFPRHDHLFTLLVIGIVALYVLLMATPFMPGIELGLGLMMLLGNKGALLVYLATVAALSISFVVGRVVPPAWLRAVLDWLQLHRAAALIEQLEPLSAQQRMAFLDARLPPRAARLLLTHRYLAIALVLNLPGNAIIGGGGGIGLVVGMSRVLGYPGYLLLVSLAVAPIPIWYYFFG